MNKPAKQTSASAVSRALKRADISTAQTGYDTYGVFVHGKGHVQVVAVYRDPAQVRAQITRVTEALTAKGYIVTPSTTSVTGGVVYVTKS